MMPCCDTTYAQYLNEDGSVDWEVYLDAMDRAFKYQTDQARKFLKDNPQGTPFRNVEFKLTLDPTKVCTCSCHVKGLGCMH